MFISSPNLGTMCLAGIPGCAARKMSEGSEADNNGWRYIIIQQPPSLSRFTAGSTNISTEPVLKKLQRRKISVLYTGGSDLKEDFKKIILRMIRKKLPNIY